MWSNIDKILSFPQLELKPVREDMIQHQMGILDGSVFTRFRLYVNCHVRDFLQPSSVKPGETQETSASFLNPVRRRQNIWRIAAGGYGEQSITWSEMDSQLIEKNVIVSHVVGDGRNHRCVVRQGKYSERPVNTGLSDNIKANIVGHAGCRACGASVAGNEYCAAGRSGYFKFSDQPVDGSWLNGIQYSLQVVDVFPGKV